jgi:hypothetical protein
MKKTILLALALSTALFACPRGCGQPGPSQNDGKQCAPRSCNGELRLGSVFETLAYALDIMELQEKPEIQIAIKSYQMHMASMARGMDTRAFKEGKFDRELYIKNSFHTQKVNAEVKLFDDIYAVLTPQEKTKLHQLMSAHQVYVKGFKEQQRQNCQARQK